MFSVRLVNPDESNDGYIQLVTLMEDFTIDNLILAFIRECVKRVNGDLRNLLPDPEKGEQTVEFLIFRDEDNIGIMSWCQSEITGEYVLALMRKDRGNNLYFYSPEGELLRHDTHQ